jgi:hypothetical protein
MALVKVFRTRQDITEDVRKWENDFEEGEKYDFQPGHPTFKILMN